MSTAVDIIESLVKYCGSTELSRYLKSCDETRIFAHDKDEIPAVIALTNRLLNESYSRRDGLLLLKCLLGQLPSELLQANLVSWIQQAVKGLAQKDSFTTVVVAAEVTCIILSLSLKFAECRKEISLTVVGKIFEILYDLKNSEEFLKLVLSTLSTLLQYYSKSGASWKEKFEKFLITLIENGEESVILASRCYLGLASCGPPGTELTNYKENWVAQFNSLSTALHQILDKLFDNVNEIEQFSRGRIKWKPNFQLPQVTERIVFLRMNRLARQFSSLCQYLEVMLLGQFPTSKRVKPESVLSVACRGLAVTPQILLAHETSDTPSLSAVLPQLHSSCLAVVGALIKSCRTNLISYGPMICKLLSQVLKSTEIQKGAYGQNKPYSSVRVSAYKCLTSWLSATTCSSNIEKHPEIVHHLISDIQFKKPSVTLNISSKMLKGKSGKKQRQALVNQTVGKRDDYVADKEANKDVCRAALGVVPALLESASPLLPPTCHKDLQTAITSELLAAQLNSGDHLPLPYSNKACRLGLYKSFVATCLNYHPAFPPPLSFASQLISHGLRDPSQEIVQFCTLSSYATEKMLRPVGPTLCFPMELPELFTGMNRFGSVRTNSGTDVSSTTPQPAEKSSMSESKTDADDLPSNELAPANSPDSASNERAALSSPSNEPVAIDSSSNDQAPTNSPNVPEINPLLVDPEMSEFDFLNNGKDVGYDKNNSVDDLRESESSDVRLNGHVPASSEPLKRKPSLEPIEVSPVLKKTKSSATEKTVDRSDVIAVEVDVEACEISPKDTTTAVETTSRLSVPENDLEEEMLSSFVDCANDD